MTREEKNILLKDLCARLPYGFTIHRYSDNRDITFEPNELDEFAHFLEYSEGEEFKPYLRPMSSMTEEERKQLACKIGAEEIELQTEFKYFFAKYFYCGEYDNNGNECLYFSLEMYIKAIEWFLENHFDYRIDPSTGKTLIESGLALEAKEGMYKTE